MLCGVLRLTADSSAGVCVCVCVCLFAQTLLTSLAEHGDGVLRALLLSLLLAPDSNSPGANADPNSPDPTHQRRGDLSPRCRVAPFSLHSKLLQLMTCLEAFCKRYSAEFLFALCDQNGEYIMITVTHSHTHLLVPGCCTHTASVRFMADLPSWLHFCTQSTCPLHTLVSHSLLRTHARGI
jgi:hypothetical protein